ncbi:MAG: uracil-xanthine permease family protein [Christensenellales bacterium]
MKLIYNVEDKPKFNKLIVFALQQVLAIMAATIAVPTIIGLPTQIPAAILGAGLGTIVYLLFTKFKSPVIISSSFAFLSSLGSALAFGYCGIIVGGILAGLVYVIIAIVIHFAGTAWVSKLMPPVIIGPTVAIIGLSLAGSAMGDIVKASVGTAVNASYNLVALLCGLITFITVVICSTQKRFKMGRLIPFIIGIGVGYAFAAFFSIFGYTLDVDYLKIINWAPLVDNFKVLGDAAASAGDKVQAFFTYPDFALIEAIKEIASGSTEVGKTYFFESAAGFGEVAIAFIPVALVVFAEHIADHKNLSSIINRDLVEGEPGLKRTLLGDGVGSMVGTVFGICPNTTYGESVGCIAITKNASVSTLLTAAIMCIILSFMSPIMALLQTIPNCVMGGVCLTLYGFIAVSGLKMFKDIDLGENKNLFTVSAILIAGIGGLAIKIPYHIAGSDVYDAAGNLVMAAGTVDKTITITSIATALILGIITYAVINAVEKKNAKLPDLPDDEGAEKENAINAPVKAETTYEVGVDVTTLNENKEESEEKVSEEANGSEKGE